MTLLLKDPEAALDYGVDWGSEYLVEESIASSEWGIEPDEPGGLAIESDRFDAASTTASLQGGVAGRVYRLVNRIETSSGKRDARSFTVRVEKR